MGDGQFRNVEFSIQINLTCVKKKMQRTLQSQGKIEYINRAFNKKLIDYPSQL